MDNKLNKIMPLVILAGVITFLVVRNWEVASGIIVALLGFGMLVFVHELGHFLVARKNDVQCDAFAIGMAIGTPFLLGIKKIENAWRIRVLPKTSGIKESPETDCLYMFDLPSKGGAGDTEYCLGPLPIGGFVKMVGQDDSGPVDTTNDTNPRSFANKSIGARMWITAAGVLANIIAAFIIFISLAFYGIERVPAVVGNVLEGYPAAEAGLEPGDEIIEIDGKSRWVGGKSNLDFTHVALSPMLGKRGEAIDMKVQKTDGTVQELQLVPALLPGGNYGFGIEKPSVLKLADIDDPDGYYEQIGLMPGDEVFAVKGEPVATNIEFEKIVERSFLPKITVSAKRDTGKTDAYEAVSTTLDLYFSPAQSIDGKLQILNAANLVPLLKVVGGLNLADSGSDAQQLGKKFVKGDTVLSVGDVEYPNFSQFRDVVSEHRNAELSVKVLRDGSVADITVVPVAKGDDDRPIVGVELNLDMERAVVASSQASPIEAGSEIKAINGKEVSSFYQVASFFDNSAGGKVNLVYEFQGQQDTVEISVPQDAVTIKASLKNPIPFDDYRRLYKAANPLQALHMGGYLILDMVDQAISSIKGLVLKRVSAEEMSGPVGIARISYVIVQRHDFAFFLYFLGMISCFLAVFNFLPIPVVDGGLFVLLIIEKIKGSPVSLTVQKYLVYAGMGLLVALLVFVTFNDILKIIQGRL